MSTRGDRIGDNVAEAINSPPLDVRSGTPDEIKHRIWRAICNALEIEFEPAWIHIQVDPTAGAGVAAPPETMAWQEAADTLLPVAVWLKSNVADTAWSRVWPADVGGLVSLSTELPLEDGIADPGDTSSGQATAKRHVHPDKDTVGGDLYLINAAAAVPIVYYATARIGMDNNPALMAGPDGEWYYSGVAVNGTQRGSPGTP